MLPGSEIKLVIEPTLRTNNRYALKHPRLKPLQVAVATELSMTSVHGITL